MTFQDFFCINKFTFRVMEKMKKSGHGPRLISVDPQPFSNCRVVVAM
jgi:hypothetical protein